jgi:hypothetical protein
MKIISENNVKMKIIETGKHQCGEKWRKLIWQSENNQPKTIIAENSESFSLMKSQRKPGEIS